MPGLRMPVVVQPFWGDALLLGRVTVDTINVRSEPAASKPIVGKRHRDQLIAVYQEFRAPDGPAHNPLWYLIDGGWVYSAYVQRIILHPKNKLLEAIPAGGILGEVTAPYAQAFRFTLDDGWQPLYRLYYSSIHWIYGIDSGPDGSAWYRIQDHFIGADYHVPASALRAVASREFSPISTEVPAQDKRIEISVDDQTLAAYEGSRLVFHTLISSGRPDPNTGSNEIPTDTPQGSFRIQLKMPSRHMGDGHLTAEIGSYELSGVPWTCVFHKTGAALHGTYWHNNFGTKMSHGCVNLRNEDALWLFRWTDPVYTGDKYFKSGNGTLVIIR